MNSKDELLAILNESARSIEKIGKNGFDEIEKINLKLAVILGLSEKVSRLKFNSQKKEEFDMIKEELLVLKLGTLEAIENQDFFSKALIVGIESGFGCRIGEIIRRVEKIC